MVLIATPFVGCMLQVRDMISQFKASRVTMDRYSECHFFNGFDWQFVLQVSLLYAIRIASSCSIQPSAAGTRLCLAMLSVYSLAVVVV